MADKKTLPIEKKKRIALVAHDNTKPDLLRWAKDNKDRLTKHELFATGSTGKLLEEELNVEIHKLMSGSLGGDQQIGARISQGDINFLVFFWDPLSPLPHDPDIKALLRMAVLWNIPLACDKASADFMITSPLMDEEYPRLLTEEIDSGEHRRLLLQQMERRELDES
jgi:methylglyoxal synthase